MPDGMVTPDRANLPDSLDDLAHEINGILEREADVGAQFDDELNEEIKEHQRHCEDIAHRKSDAIKDLRLEAGHLLIAAKTKVTSGKWREWLHENIQRGVSDCYQCMKMAGADDPDKEREKEKERAREGMRKTRESRKPPVSVTSPVTDIPAPGPVTLPKEIVQNAPLPTNAAPLHAETAKPIATNNSATESVGDYQNESDGECNPYMKQAAELFDVEYALVECGKVVLERGIPELVRKVEREEISLTAGAELARATPETQREIIEKIKVTNESEIADSPATLEAFQMTVLAALKKLDEHDRIAARAWLNKQFQPTEVDAHYVMSGPAQPKPETVAPAPDIEAAEVAQPVGSAMALAMAPDDRITAPANETEPELLSPAARDALRKLKEYAKANAAPWLNFTQCEDRGISEDAIEELLRAGLIIHPPGNENVVGIEPEWMRKQRLARERAVSAETSQ